MMNNFTQALQNKLKLSENRRNEKKNISRDLSSKLLFIKYMLKFTKLQLQNPKDLLKHYKRKKPKTNTTVTMQIQNLIFGRKWT